MATPRPGPDEGYSEDPMGNQLARSRAAALNLDDASNMPEGDRERLMLALGNGLSKRAFCKALVALLGTRSPSEALEFLNAGTLTLDEEYRKRHAYSSMRTLRPPLILDVLNDIGPILHINFMDKLPPEVCLRILEYLSPAALIAMAQTSRSCFSLAMDWTLWQHSYNSEGFLVNVPELKKFEQQLNDDNARKQSNRERSRSSIGDAPPRKRTKSDEESSKETDGEYDKMEVDPASSQASIFGMTPADKFDNSDGQRAIAKPWPSRQWKQYQSGSESNGVSNRSPSGASPGGNELDSMSSLVVHDRRSNKKMLNWQHLYTQRRKLESNWDKGRFINYQLPHPDFPEEGHRECVYAIQHDGRNLVSGSRDNTIRIWNLEKRRLVMPPLRGHEGSVLCLQFDADPKEDIIVSGSSDSTVRIWRFSTGKLIQVLTKAHHESVLNVRFDDRVLVTCSKDKTIKVFNRRPLHPGELGYKLPEGFNEVPRVVNVYGEMPSPYEGLPVKPAFSLISVLEGHGAAVNAVQVLGREVVSASGDRHAKVWDWPTQQCTRSLVGHTKGIACVQYDGRRIVTGSSDNEIKVFDRETSCEVASLQGHSALVRTVQAGFADVATSREDDLKTAEKTDMQYFQAIAKGKITADKERKFTRNAGSRKPQDIIAYGAKLPPGGGGGKYGRIVSGSYDETIIVWTRDEEGAWIAKHTLRQAEAARDAMVQHELSRPVDSSSDDYLAKILESIQETSVSGPTSPQWCRELIDKAVSHGVAALRQACRDFPFIVNFPRLISAVMQHPDKVRMRAVVHAALKRESERVVREIADCNAEMATLESRKKQEDDSHKRIQASVAESELIEGDSLVADAQLAAAGKISPRKKIPHGPPDTVKYASAHPAFGRPTPLAQPLTSFASPASASASTTAPFGAPAHEPLVGITAPPSVQIDQVTSSRQSYHRNFNRHFTYLEGEKKKLLQQQQALQNAISTIKSEAPAGGRNAAEQAPAHVETMNRVFKLQFDARRIVCCSQNPTIVIWDFANGDKALEEACRFFKGVE